MITAREKFFYTRTLCCLLKALEGSEAEIELRNDAHVKGTVENVSGSMSVTMVDCELIVAGRMRCLERMFVHGRKIRMVVIPDHIDMVSAMQSVIDMFDPQRLKLLGRNEFKKYPRGRGRGQGTRGRGGRGGSLPGRGRGDFGRGGRGRGAVPFRGRGRGQGFTSNGRGYVNPQQMSMQRTGPGFVGAGGFRNQTYFPSQADQFNSSENFPTNIQAPSSSAEQGNGAFRETVETIVSDITDLCGKLGNSPQMSPVPSGSENLNPRDIKNKLLQLSGVMPEASSSSSRVDRESDSRSDFSSPGRRDRPSSSSSRYRDYVRKHQMRSSSSSPESDLSGRRKRDHHREHGSPRRYASSDAIAVDSRHSHRSCGEDSKASRSRRGDVERQSGNDSSTSSERLRSRHRRPVDSRSPDRFGESESSLDLRERLSRRPQSPRQLSPVRNRAPSPTGSGYHDSERLHSERSQRSREHRADSGGPSNHDADSSFDLRNRLSRRHISPTDSSSRGIDSRSTATSRYCDADRSSDASRLNRRQDSPFEADRSSDASRLNRRQDSPRDPASRREGHGSERRNERSHIDRHKVGSSGLRKHRECESTASGLRRHDSDRACSTLSSSRSHRMARESPLSHSYRQDSPHSYSHRHSADSPHSHRHSEESAHFSHRHQESSHRRSQEPNAEVCGDTDSDRYSDRRHRHGDHDREHSGGSDQARSQASSHRRKERRDR